jgi:hypothetical protein
LVTDVSTKIDEPTPKPTERQRVKAAKDAGVLVALRRELQPDAIAAFFSRDPKDFFRVRPRLRSVLAQTGFLISVVGVHCGV